MKKANAVLKLLASWSLQTAKRGDAHIIFVANNVYAEDVLRKGTLHPNFDLLSIGVTHFKQRRV